MQPFYQDEQVTLWQGDNREVLRQLPAGAVQCAVTSPPYWGLRDYGVAEQIGLEASVNEYVAARWTCSVASGACYATMAYFS